MTLLYLISFRNSIDLFCLLEFLNVFVVNNIRHQSLLGLVGYPRSSAPMGLECCFLQAVNGVSRFLASVRYTSLKESLLLACTLLALPSSSSRLM